VRSVRPHRTRRRLLVCAHDVAGTRGMERTLHHLLKFAVRDFDVTVVSRTLPPDLVGLVVWRRVRVPRAPISVKFLLFYVLASLQVMKSRPDVVHVTGAIVANRADVCQVHYCHGSRPLADLISSRRHGSLVKLVDAVLVHLLSLAAERWSYRRSRTRVVAAVSPGLALEVASAYPNADVRVLTHGVELGSPTRAAADVRAELGATADDKVMLFVGGNWEHKGLDIVFEAMTLLDLQPWLWVAGSGDSDRYRERARALGIADRLRLLGPRDDPAELYYAADLLVLPSLYETFSLVVHEAAGAGLPIVVTDVHGGADLVRAADNGVVTKRAPEDVARAVGAMLARDDLSAVGARGVSHVSAMTWDEAYRALRTAYVEPEAAVRA
jgi:glycosyltransferase involved in cell wall biosynthesis